MFKFKVDENLPFDVVLLLRFAGHDAVSVLDQGLGGQPDRILAAVCRAEGRALLTLDLDFADIRVFPPADYPGIIVLRLRRLQRPVIVAMTRRLILLLQSEPLVGKLWIADETAVRVRD